MKAEEDAGGKSISRADSSDDALLRHMEAALDVEFSIMSERAGPLGEVDDDPFADSGCEKLAGGRFDRRQRNEAAQLGGDAGRAFDFELVHDAIVRVAQGWKNDVREALAVLAHDIDAGFETRFPGLVQHPGGGGAEFRIGLIQQIEEQEVAKVEDFGIRSGEGKMFGCEEGIGSTLMEKSAASGGLDGHHIGVGSGCRGMSENAGAINAVRIALSVNPVPIGIRTDQADACERKGGAQAGEVEEHIEWATAIAGGFRQAVGERVLLRIGVDEFQFVDDPVAAGEDSFAGTHAFLSLRRRRMAGSSSSRIG